MLWQGYKVIVFVLYIENGLPQFDSCFFLNPHRVRNHHTCVSHWSPLMVQKAWFPPKKHSHQMSIICFDTRKPRDFKTLLSPSCLFQNQRKKWRNSLFFCLPQLENFDVKGLKLQWLTTRKSWWFRICLSNVQPYLVRRSKLTNSFFKLP